MKSPMIILVIILVVVILGVSVFTLPQNSSKSDSMLKKDEAMMPKEETSSEPTDTMMKINDNVVENKKMIDDKTVSSRYIQYSKSALESASGSRRVLFFYASWCPTCKPADLSFTQNVQKIPEDVTLFRVNYNDPDTDDEEKQLAKKYNITYQHTFVQLDSLGNEVNKWNGGQINELIKNIK